MQSPFLLLGFLLSFCDSIFVSAATFDNELVEPSVNPLEARQGPAVAAQSSFLRRSFTSSAVAGSYVYIDGGEFSYITGATFNVHYSATLLSIDLTTSWTNETVNIQSTPKPSGVPILVSSSLWYSQKNNLLYTGYTGRTSFYGGPLKDFPIQQWSFKPDGSGAGTWAETANNPGNFHISRPFVPLQAYGGEIAILLGGMANAGTQPIYVNLTGQMALPGLITYDMASDTFTNTSTAGKTIYGGDGFAANGVMQYVPSFGPNGIFVAMGGSVQATETPSVLQSFEQVSVYDPAAKLWYNQTTTGDIPAPRLKSCSAGVASSNGTYDILLYAGFGGQLGTAAIPYDDAHILTLPAFHWIKVDSFTAQSPRYGQSCNAVGGSQILTIGGVDANPKNPSSGPDDVRAYNSTFSSTADPFTQGLGIFDMSTLSFANGYTANAGPYVQSDPVVQYYAQNPNPKFDSPDLQTLFKTSNFPPSTSNSSSSSSSSSSSTSSTSNTGAIVGGVIGGLAFLAILAALIYFFLVIRPRRRQQRNQQGAGSGSRGDYSSVFQPASSPNTTAAEKDHQNSIMKPDDIDASLAKGEYTEMYSPPAELGPGGPGNERDGRAELPAQRQL